MKAIPTDAVTSERDTWLDQLLPGGLPRLWCPLLTHYADDGSIDLTRMRRHLDFLQGSVQGYLVPGSTGDGWELSEDEADRLIAFTLAEARSRRTPLLLGALDPDAQRAATRIESIIGSIRRHGDAGSERASLAQALVFAFTVCPPTGSGLTQTEIEESLENLLARGWPISLYQLPQVTGNEMSPELVSRLAARHPNLVMLKDSSGADRVADAGIDRVWLLRGAEGDYATQLRAQGGHYDGLLLSTANCFGPALARMIGDLDSDLDSDRQDAANAFSRRLGALVAEVFEAAAGLPRGNAFTNSNKAFDHFAAHGPGALKMPAPMLHAGVRLPDEFIARVGAAMRRHALMPEFGYLGS